MTGVSHIPHIEDIMFDEGVEGARKAINIFRAFRDGNLQMSIKWDGAPAFVAGIHPETKRFFVSTKSFFNKKPKINYSDVDIDRNHPKPGLNQVLKWLLLYLPELGIQGVYQGDFLFINNDLKVEDIAGEKYVTFQPNVIKYAVPLLESNAACHSWIGVAIHTFYDENMNVATQKHSCVATPNVWVADVQAKIPEMESWEKHTLKTGLTMAGKGFQSIPREVFDSFTPESRMNIKKIINTMYRNGENIDDLKINMPLEYGPGLVELIYGLVAAKMTVLENMRKTQSIRCFIDDKETGHEGYVVSTPESLVKLVDRSEFSYFNFQKRDVPINRETWQL